MTDEQKALQEIESQSESWKSKWMKEQWIFDEIAMEINSHTGKDREFWGRVMDLYKNKYR